MATQNYFAMDPAISRTVSNLTRALIGSPSDDAASARARYYDEQTKAQQLQSRGLQEQLDAQNAAAATNILRNQVANVFGGQLDNGNLIRRPLPGGPQQSVPLLPNQNQMSQEDVANQLGALARSMYGDGTSNANQLSQMLGNLAESGQSRLAQSMILGGSDDQAARGALMLKGGNKYNNTGFAETELQTDDATARREDDMRFGIGGQGDRDTQAQETTDQKSAWIKTESLEKSVWIKMQDRRGGKNIKQMQTPKLTVKKMKRLMLPLDIKLTTSQ